MMAILQNREKTYSFRFAFSCPSSPYIDAPLLICPSNRSNISWNAFRQICECEPFRQLLVSSFRIPAHSSTPIILKYRCCNCSDNFLKRLQAATASSSKRGRSNLRQKRQKASFLMLLPASPSLPPFQKKNSIQFCRCSSQPMKSTSQTRNSPGRWPSVLAKSSISLYEAWQVSFSMRQTSSTYRRIGLSLTIWALSSCVSIFLKVAGLPLRPSCAANTRSSILLSTYNRFFRLKNSSSSERNYVLRIFSREVQAFHRLKLLQDTVRMERRRNSLKQSSGSSSRLTSAQIAQCWLILRKIEMILRRELLLWWVLMTVTIERNFQITDLPLPQLFRMTYNSSKRKLQRLVRLTFRYSDSSNLLRYFSGFWTGRLSYCFIKCLRIRSYSCPYFNSYYCSRSSRISCYVPNYTPPMCSL